ncbi:MAG: PAC2 family protein, partial [Gemmatimonadetes bacterium]|nr:PAC2 family protein [Gemmatimonadota bacterium]
ISSVISERFAARGVACVSLWGHSPHYVQTSPNPGLTHAILTELLPLLPVEVDLSDLEAQARRFSSTLNRALQDQAEITGYIRRLEERYDAQEPESRDSSERPDPTALLEDLEDFLRRERSGGEEDAST